MTTHEATALAATAEPVKLAPACGKCGQPKTKRYTGLNGQWHWQCIPCHREYARERYRALIADGMSQSGVPVDARLCEKCQRPMERHEGNIHNSFREYWECAPCKAKMQAHRIARYKQARKEAKGTPDDPCWRERRHYWAAVIRLGLPVYRRRWIGPKERPVMT